MKFILTIIISLNGAPVTGELQSVFPKFTNKATACAVLVQIARKLPTIQVVNCNRRIEV